MDSPLKLLIIEDVPADFLLLERNLRQNGIAAEWRRIGNDAELNDALQSEWDVVLADFNVPGMDFRTTLLNIQAHRPDLPVIMVSGSVGEETAVELLRLGIVDFILKDHLARLPNAIRRALVEANERRARQAAEMALHKLAQAVEQSPESIAITDLDANIEYVNESFLRITGYTREEVIGQNPSMLHSDKTPKCTYDALWKSMAEGKIWQGEFYNKRKDGSEFIAHTIISPIRQPDGRITNYVEIKEDITERKKAQASIVYLNRVYAMLSGINTLIVRVRERDELFREACRIAVEIGGFRMAMIAIVDQSAMNVVPVASVGKDEKLLTAIKGVLSSSETAPNTILARAIREKKPVVSNDSKSDPRVLFNKNYTESEVRSMAVLPLIVSDETVGVFALYASEREF
ncbi:MAG: PAS domain S-box protein, partial [Candidatus Nitrotoga sp.]|nr:PAS domain S-box protein [Candidatus Nitrotoga sp.]